MRVAHALLLDLVFAGLGQLAGVILALDIGANFSKTVVNPGCRRVRISAHEFFVLAQLVQGRTKFVKPA